MCVQPQSVANDQAVEVNEDETTPFCSPEGMALAEELPPDHVDEPSQQAWPLHKELVLHTFRTQQI